MTIFVGLDRDIGTIKWSQYSWQYIGNNASYCMEICLNVIFSEYRVYKMMQPLLNEYDITVSQTDTNFMVNKKTIITIKKLNCLKCNGRHSKIVYKIQFVNTSSVEV